MQGWSFRAILEASGKVCAKHIVKAEVLHALRRGGSPRGLKLQEVCSEEGNGKRCLEEGVGCDYGERSQKGVSFRQKDVR